MAARKKRKRPIRRPRRARDDDPREHGDNLSRALELHQAGRLPEAERLYREIHESGAPRREVVHLLGRVCFDQGRKEEAVEWLRTATELDPTRAEAYNDLGNVLSEVRREAEAERAYRRALELDERNSSALVNLGILLKNRGLLAESIESFRRALRSDADDGQAHYHLGITLKTGGDLAGAADHLRRAVELLPDMTDARHVLCGVLREAGRTDELREAFDDWLRRAPNDPVASHLRAALDGDKETSRASDDYVRTVFDRFASHFDEDLAALGYATPELLAALIRRVLGPPRGDLSVLDAGCGTGLCGPHLRPFAARLDGVDLSTKMLERAGRRRVYDGLEAGELTEFMGRNAGRYDVVAAADTFNYFGDLRPLFGRARDAMSPRGHVFFSLEAHDDASGSEYSLRANGRYGHSSRHVREVLAGAGLTVEAVQEVTMRKEAGDDVRGLLFAARKSPDAVSCGGSR